MIKKNFQRLLSSCGIDTKVERGFFIAAFILLLIYLEAAVAAQLICLVGFSLPWVIAGALVVPIFAFFAVLLVAKLRSVDDRKAFLQDISPKGAVLFSLTVFFFTFAFYLLWFIAFYPGSFSSDNIGQYEQVIGGSYNNWHPAIHTWLFYTLPLSLGGNAGTIVLFQIVYFSLAVAYFISTLRKSGCGRVFMIISWLFIMINPNTAHIVLYPWKDTAFSIFSLLVFTQLIRIYKTDGKWLRSPLNIAAFSACMFLLNTVRHNGILLTLPIFVILFIFKKGIRKQTVISLASVLVSMAILSGPVYSLFSVEEPGNRQTELLGLPMTVIANVYMNDRDALSEEAIEFMDSLATEEEWEKYHVTGNFNILKWSSSADVLNIIEAEGAKNVLSYMLEAFKNSPIYASLGMLRLTTLVWGFAGDKNYIPIGIVDNSYGIEYSNEGSTLATLLNYYFSATQVIFKYFYGFVGVMIIAMLIMAVARLGKSGLSKVFLVLSPCAYNFGTMLLLTGPDFRFFHFNFLIIVPIAYLLFTKKADGDDNIATNDENDSCNMIY